MSRLFDALENIEKREMNPDDNSDSLFPGSAAVQGNRNTSGRRWLFLTLICAFMVGAGTGGLFIMNFMDRPVRDTGPAVKAAQTSAENPAAPPPQQISEPAETCKTAVPAAESLAGGRTDPLKKEQQKIEMLVRSLPRPAEATGTPAIVNPVYKSGGHRRHTLQNTSPGPVESTPDAVNETLISSEGAFQPDVKRLLQQAEELRTAGHIRDAMAIYSALWKRTHSPLIANNLAAAMIVAEMPERARKILSEALRLNPDDPDLLYNLQVISSGNMK